MAVQPGLWLGLGLLTYSSLTTLVYELVVRFGPNYTSAKFHVCISNAIRANFEVSTLKYIRQLLWRTDPHVCRAPKQYSSAGRVKMHV